jgi:pimeloyl-ACP methyl ester carboxylesterase
MGRKARGGIGGVGVGANELAGAGPLQLAALEHQAVDALAAGPPGEQPPLHLRALEARALGELARRQEPRRSGDARDQVQSSETFRGVDPDVAHRRAALEGLQFALKLGDRAGDLGRAAVLDRSAIVGDARDRAVPLRLQNLEARFQLGNCCHRCDSGRKSEEASQTTDAAERCAQPTQTLDGGATYFVQWTKESWGLQEQGRGDVAEGSDLRRVCVYEGARHNVQWERPERVAKDIAEFMEYLPSRAGRERKLRWCRSAPTMN